MKLIGHAWIAVNAVPQANRKLLILGSILPEIMYYTKDHPFQFEEIHEGGERLYQYLVKEKPVWKDLGLGMATHSVKKGADKFNSEENLAILGYQAEKAEELQSRLSSILAVSYETTATRAHNILELAVELGIIKDHPDFIDEFQEAITDKAAREKIKSVLSECYTKPKDKVGRVVEELFEKAKPEYFRSAEGLARLWKELSSAIPDPEPDIRGLAKLINELSLCFAGRDKEFLKRSIEWTRSNIEAVFSHPERKLG